MSSFTQATTMTNAGVASHYDDLDTFYREIWGEHVHHGVWHTGKESDLEAAENLVRMAIQVADVQPGERVCDIGCGYGATARILAARHGASVVGMTLSKVQVEYARTNNHVPGLTEFRQQNWYENDLPDASFDIVFTLESLEHMPDLPTFFREAYRVLKPGGRLVASAWMCRENLGSFTKRHFIDPISRETQIAGVRPLSEFRAATEAAGFTAFDFQDLSKKAKRTWPLCALRVLKGLLTQSRYRRFIFGSENPNRIFALTVFRIWLAYELGIQRYVIYGAQKSQ